MSGKTYTQTQNGITFILYNRCIHKRYIIHITLILAMEFKCETCGREFTRSDHYHRHVRGHDEAKTFSCGTCSKTFQRKDNKQQHEKNCGSPGSAGEFSCGKCNKTFQMKHVQQRHEKTCQPSARGGGITHRTLSSSAPIQSTFKVHKTSTAYSNATTTWELIYKENDGLDYAELLKRSVFAMKDYIKRIKLSQHALKFNMSLHVNFEKATDPSIKTEPPVVLVTEQIEMYEHTNLDDVLKTLGDQLINRIEIYELNGSGFIVSNLVSLDTTTWLLDPIRGSTFHPLPDWIRRKNAMINIENEDDRCFKWSVLAGVYEPTGNPKLVSSYTDCEVCTLLYIIFN